MEEECEDSFSTRLEWGTPLVRRLSHDVRNGLNGLEMEASLLEVLHPDQGTLESIRRLRRQGGEIELALRFMVARFVDPAMEVIPAIDVFQLWKSRCKPLASRNVIDWKDESGDALIHVDASLVADALCESIASARGVDLEAAVRMEKSEVLFEIRQKPDSPDRAISGGKEWPGWQPLIRRNGGRLEVSGDPREFLQRCWFPICQNNGPVRAEDEGSEF